MKKGLLVFLALCALATAMVPRERESSSTISSTSTTVKPRNICAPRTPCAWALYKGDNKIIEYTAMNSYCECGAGTQCVIDDDETGANAFILHCKPPSDGEEAIAS